MIKITPSNTMTPKQPTRCSNEAKLKEKIIKYLSYCKIPTQAPYSSISAKLAHSARFQFQKHLKTTTPKQPRKLQNDDAETTK
ncbi:25241_t:CDS:2 [Dentiscutata erythropus]|uniref:25241_t:CDS:1 n=1 Tax=Dentiscutata erythropus TaxID=1348616 RepID=A0A9N9JM59_9GLOM|nr:25241_t:CDS:2 [Dentiscutata erythropus]